MTAAVLGAVIPGAVAEVISGTEEATLSFAGAVGELDPAAAPSLLSTWVAGLLRWLSVTRPASRPATRPTSGVCG